MKTIRMNSEKEKKRKIQRREEPNPRSIRMSKKRKENLTLDPFGCQRKEKEEQQIREKKRKIQTLITGRTVPSPAWEKKCRAGAVARRAWSRGRRGQATRRRRAHPSGSTRAGEGAGDGAVARCSLPLGVLSVAAAALR